MAEMSEPEIKKELKELLKDKFSGKQLEKATEILDHLLDCETLLISDDSTTFKLFDKPISFVEYLSNALDDENFTVNFDYDRVTLELIARGALKELFLK